MARSVVLGNGNMLVGLDEWANVRDFYFPMVGLENHVGERLRHRIGVWVDGDFSWIHDGNWNMNTLMGEDVLRSKIEAVNERLGVSLSFCDAVYNEKNIFLRSIEVKNMKSEERDIRVFFAHEFHPYASSTAHTAYYDPIQKTLVHYKVRRAFVINARIDGEVWSDYTTGVFGIEGKDGSFRDAEDGTLSKNPIEHGPADSVMGLYGTYGPEECKKIHYWIAAAKDIPTAVKLNAVVLEKTPEHILKSTYDFWHSWATKQNFQFPEELDEACGRLFRRSLLMIRAHTNNNGAIIASSDSGMLQKGKDTYAYVWPRDSAFISLALAGAGYLSISREVFRFFEQVVEPMGYFMHKYSPDMSLGSSWHPWVRNGKFELPIQKDETASIIYALKQYYDISKNLELVEQLYDSLVAKTADFLCDDLDNHTGLPSASYDLWEERFGIHTFTVASIYGGLCSAADIAALLGKTKQENKWRTRAEAIRESLLEYLYDETRGVFYRMVNISYKDESDLELKDPEIILDKTIDISSGYGVYLFGVLEVDDPRLVEAMQKSHDALACNEKGAIGGLARYENDGYNRASEYTPGNPWFVTSLWYAQYTIARAKKKEDLEEAASWIHWAKDHAMASGVMAEQMNPYTGESLSATPLTWSHAEYVRTVLEYMKKREQLKKTDEPE